MKNYQNVIISGARDYFLAVNYKDVYTTPKCLAYDNSKLPIERNEVNASVINALSVLNKYLCELSRLKSIQEKDKNKDKGSNNHVMCYISIPDDLHKTITKGTYKSWVKRGKTTTGKDINSLELSEWKKFAQLYFNLFLDIEFRSNNHYMIKQPKYNKQSIMFGKEIIDRCEELRKEHEANSFEDVMSGILI